MDAVRGPTRHATFLALGLDEPPRAWQRRCLDSLSSAGVSRAESRAPDLVLELGDVGTVEDPDLASKPRWGRWQFRVDGRGIENVEDVCREALLSGRYSVRARLTAARCVGDAVIIREGRLPLLSHSLEASVASIHEELGRWPAYAARYLARTSRLDGPRIVRDSVLDPDLVAPSEPDPPPRFRRWGRRSACLARTGWNGLRAALRTLFRHDHWNVGVVRKPIQAFLSPGPEEEVEWWPTRPRAGFRADPFGVRREGRLLMLYEELDYSSGRGRIVGEARGEDEARADRTGRRGDGADVRRGVAMGGTGHFSYPYLFEHESELYCVPETADRRRVALYRAVDFPTSWEEVATLLEGVAALDSTLFRHEGRWWLFAADRDAGPRHVLKAWHASDLTGTWRAHAANPVKVDVHAARPGGTPFRHGGDLYRPAQDGARSYGEAVVINRVLELTPERFAEEAVRRVTLPSDGPYPDGIHTLAAVGPELTLVDGNRRRFSAAEFRRRVGTLSGRGGG